MRRIIIAAAIILAVATPAAAQTTPDTGYPLPGGGDLGTNLCDIIPSHPACLARTTTTTTTPTSTTVAPAAVVAAPHFTG